MSPIIIYTKPNCPWCAYAKALAQSSGISYTCVPHTEFQADGGETPTWPRIVWDDRMDDPIIGGTEELLDLLFKRG